MNRRSFLRLLGVAPIAARFPWMPEPAQLPPVDPLLSMQTVWSKEILFQAMPVLRFEQYSISRKFDPVSINGVPVKRFDDGLQ